MKLHQPPIILHGCSLRYATIQIYAKSVVDRHRKTQLIGMRGGKQIKRGYQEKGGSIELHQRATDVYKIG